MTKQIIFDIDGTLIDTEKTGVLSLIKTVKELMGQEMSYEESYSYFGITSAKVASMLKYPQEEKFALLWEDNFIALSHLITVFPGAVEMIKAVKQMGFSTGIVTSRTKLEFTNEKNLKDIAPLMEHIILAEDSLKHKPDPEPMLAYIKKAGATPQQCIYIGDTIHDYNCAHSAGVGFILADWHHRGQQGIPSSCPRFQTAEELLELVQGLKKGI